MTTVVQVQLVAPTQLGNADANVYAAPTSTTAKIGRAVFCNTSGAATTITAGLTASSGTALTAATTLITARVIAIGETYVSPELAGLVIPAGSSLRVYAGAGTAVTFEASGLTIQ